MSRASWAAALLCVGCRVSSPVGADDLGETDPIAETASESGGSGASSEASSDAGESAGGSGSETTSGGGSDSGSSESGSESESGSGSTETGEALSVEVVTLDYGDDLAQVLDLYLPSPPPPDPMPTLVLAHGGLWQSGGKSALAELCQHVVLASGGTIACASLDYRLSQDLGGHCMDGGPDTYEEQLRDFGAAFVTLQNQSGLHGLDPARMLVGGHSAGGHLAHSLNLRWGEFAGVCTLGGGCPAAIAAIGIEGIYSIAAWDAYDESFWNGLFGCATRKAFGDAPGSSMECIDPQFNRACWDIGSPTYLAEHAGELGFSPVGNALMIHSPGDDWVDIGEASGLGAALESAFPGISVIVSIDGTCATAGHDGTLAEQALAGCLVSYVGSGGTAI